MRQLVHALVPESSQAHSVHCVSRRETRQLEIRSQFVIHLCSSTFSMSSRLCCVQAPVTVTVAAYVTRRLAFVAATHLTLASRVNKLVVQIIVKRMDMPVAYVIIQLASVSVIVCTSAKTAHSVVVGSIAPGLVCATIRLANVDARTVAITVLYQLNVYLTHVQLAMHSYAQDTAYAILVHAHVHAMKDTLEKIVHKQADNKVSLLLHCCLHSYSVSQIILYLRAFFDCSVGPADAATNIWETPKR